MKWNYNKLKNYANHNRIGLIIGLILGSIISYLYWTQSELLSVNTIKYLTYPLHLIFGCDVQIWGLAILILIYGIVGLCLHGIFQKWQIRDDCNRSLIILAVLVLTIAGTYMYRDNSNTFCFDVNLDGADDNAVIITPTETNGDDDITPTPSQTPPECDSDADCPTSEICSDGQCIISNGIDFQVNIGI